MIVKRVRFQKVNDFCKEISKGIACKQNVYAFFPLWQIDNRTLLMIVYITRKPKKRTHAMITNKKKCGHYGD